MTLQVYTARMGYRTGPWLDVTLLGNRRRVQKGSPGGHLGIGLAFAPSSSLLFPYIAKRKNGALTAQDWPAYREHYLAEMRQSYRTQRPAWETLLGMPEITCLCFCESPATCHRSVLAEILVTLGASAKGERGGCSA